MDIKSKKIYTAFSFQPGGIHQAVNGKIIGKIHDLVNRGVTGVQEMRREFVRTEMFPGRQIPPSTSHRYFPTEKDVQNYMYRAAVKNRFPNCEQINFSLKINKCQLQNPKDNFFLQQFSDVYQDKLETGNKDDDSTGEDDDEEEEIKITFPLSHQKLLFVHQTSWQARLLARYGNDICLWDATYRTT